MKITATTIRAEFEGVSGKAEYSSETGLMVVMDQIPPDRAVDVMQAVERAVREVLSSGSRLAAVVRDHESPPEDRRAMVTAAIVERVRDDVDAQVMSHAPQAADVPSPVASPALPATAPPVTPPSEAASILETPRTHRGSAKTTSFAQAPAADRAAPSATASVPIVASATPSAIIAASSSEVAATIDAAADRWSQANPGVAMTLSALCQIILREDAAALAEAQAIQPEAESPVPLIKAHVDRNARRFKHYSAMTDEAAKATRVRHTAVGALGSYAHAAVV